MADAVDDLLAQWAQQRPDLDPSPMGVIGRLSRAARLVEARLRPVFAAHDLDPASFDVLATLRRHDRPLSPTELTRAAMVTSGAITQRLDRLEARGLVGRAPRAGDGRGVVVALTPQGRALIDRALPDHVANEHRILAGLDAGERAALAAALRGLLLALGDTGRGRDAGDGQVGQVGRAG
jgi:DNA-binding MarR family transcriptional regulator